jgi:Protein of unknown function (DUF3034)
MRSSFHCMTGWQPLLSWGHALACLTLPGAALMVCPAQAGERLLGAWGVSQVEGAGGGGLTPWATIAGPGSSTQLGAVAYVTQAQTQGGFRLRVAGAAVGFHDKVEISMARWSFKLSDDVVPGKSLEMSVVGAKVKLLGDAVYGQDTWLPQVSLGVQKKWAQDVGSLRGLGLPIRASDDIDMYASATKLWLGAAWGYNLLGNATVRWTRANQFGLLGFGGDAQADRTLQFEGSVGVMPRDDLLVGAEWRTKPDNLRIAGFGEDNAWDLFVAWFPLRQLNVTAAWLNLGNIATLKNQRGLYLSAQLAF